MPEPPPPLVYALGFSWRKRSLLRQFFGPREIRFASRASQIPDGTTVAVWASGPFGDRSISLPFNRLFVEDGFLRSVGLGADWVRPMSWVIDSRGIYYDASVPSDLEHILQTRVFDATTLQRAGALRQKLASTGLTKYNVGSGRWRRPAEAGGRPVALAPGQVETDASLRCGAPGIRTNLALLQAARQANPDAWLVYKPHPDVVAGLRGQGEQENLAAQWCDEIVVDAPMGPLLEAVDAVHVLTSLAGFEALLRGKQVVCHGLPFYAGWGLTQDALAMPRRTKKLDIDELVAGVLLEYSIYVSRVTGQVCQAEQVLEELLLWRARSSSSVAFWRKMLRPLIRKP